MFIVAKDGKSIINTSHITGIYIGADGCTLKADFENGKGCQIARYDVDRFSKIALNFIGIVVRNKVFRCKSCGKIYPEYVPDLWWRLCRQNAPFDGFYKPTRRGSRPVVHR